MAVEESFRDTGKATYLSSFYVHTKKMVNFVKITIFEWSYNMPPHFFTKTNEGHFKRSL